MALRSNSPYDPTNTNYQSPYPSGSVYRTEYMPDEVYNGQPAPAGEREPLQGSYVPDEVYRMHTGVTDITRAPFDELGEDGGHSAGVQQAVRDGYQYPHQ